MGYQANNAVIGKSNLLKRAEIPFTIVTNAAIANDVATVGDEFKGEVEIFIPATTADGAAASRGGAGGAATSALDPSATLPTLDGGAGLANGPQIAFVVLDGSSERVPANLPMPGDGKNPAYPTTAAQLAAKGNARQTYSAFAVITDGSNTSMLPPQVGSVARADFSVTPNGNLLVRVKFPKAFLTNATPTAVANTLQVAGQTIKGTLVLAWF